MIILAEGGRRAAVRTDESSAAYVAMHVAHCERSASPGPERAVRAVVELSRAFGGMTMRALLGAEFSPDPQGSSTVFEVPFCEAMGLGAVATCASELGSPLVAGLPRDFAGAVLDGLAGDPAVRALPAGLLRVDRAGFDEAGSSEMAFKLAGDLLRSVVDTLLHHRDPLTAAQAVLSAW
ncbi:hypothetical protein ACWDQO_36145 [Streptomyces sp. NPDC003703]|uniref:hypothetical protein n=1 Tax=Streptomyces sp. NPDC003283 TaxID=3364681 RepID=UPI003697F7E5